MNAICPPNTRFPNLRLVGATVLRDGTMQNRTVAISAGKIAGGPYPVVDLTGYYIMPGIIDLHGDMLQSHTAPIEASLRLVDRDAAANGVTTAWLTQSWSWEGGIRGPDFAEQVIAALAGYRRCALTDLRLQIRYETHAIDSSDRLLTAISQFGTGYVMFNNDLDATIAAWADDPQAVECRANRSGLTGVELMQIVHLARARSRDVPRSLCRLAEAFDTMGVLYGSHADPDGETRELFSALGARICAFPAAFPAASVARALGEPVVMGAPNVVQGCGGVSATALIRAGKCDALVSDDHYPALAQAPRHTIPSFPRPSGTPSPPAAPARPLSECAYAYRQRPSPVHPNANQTPLSPKSPPRENRQTGSSPPAAASPASRPPSGTGRQWWP